MMKFCFLHYKLYFFLVSAFLLPSILFCLKGGLHGNIEDNAEVENIINDLKSKQELKDVGGLESIELFQKYRFIFNQKGTRKESGNIINNNIFFNIKSILYIDEKEELLDLQKKWMEKVGKSAESLSQSSKVRELYDLLYSAYIQNLLESLIEEKDIIRNGFEDQLAESIGSYDNLLKVDTLFYFFNKKTGFIGTDLLNSVKSEIKAKKFFLVEPYLEGNDLYFTVIYTDQDIYQSALQISSNSYSARETFLKILEKSQNKKTLELYLKAMKQKGAILNQKNELNISLDSPISSFDKNLHWFF